MYKSIAKVCQHHGGKVYQTITGWLLKNSYSPAVSFHEFYRAEVTGYQLTHRTCVTVRTVNFD